MSHSKRKPYSYWVCVSPNGLRKDKKIYHKMMRAKTREILHDFNEDKDLVIPNKNYEIMDNWVMETDGGKFFISKPTEGDEKWYKDWYEKKKRK